MAPAAFLVSYVTMDLYGGSMANSDGTELCFGSLNAALVMTLIVSMALGVLATLKTTGHERAIAQ